MSQPENHSNPPDLSNEVIPATQSSTAPSSQAQAATKDSSNDSQATTAAMTESDRVFTPPGSDSETSAGHGAANHTHASSQDSQLLQLSQLAAAQEKMAEIDDSAFNGAQSRKRMADGEVKQHMRGNSTNISPVRRGHSRNTSTVSVASTTSSRIGELSAELKAKLSYAMVKVNHGWQGHTIDEVESLASQAASPTSSTCTLYGRHGASASPRIGIPGGGKQPNASVAASPATKAPPPPSRTYESFWRENGSRPRSSTSPQVPTLAPPAAIQPRQPGYTNSRRNSSARYAPAYLSSQSAHASPHTPAQPSPLTSTHNSQTMLRTPNLDPILFSPHQNMREQEALETLVFMSSPGNSANLKHAFPSSQSQMSQMSQPPSSSSQQASQQQQQPRSSMRTALPTSRLGAVTETNSQSSRRSLPNGRPQQTNNGTTTTQAKRVGFEKSPSNVSDIMDMDDPYGSPQIRGTPRRRTNGSGNGNGNGNGNANIHAPRPSLSIPAGLSGPSRPRTKLQDADIERMLDRVAADDSSDSDGEIQIPPHDRRREGTKIGV